MLDEPTAAETVTFDDSSPTVGSTPPGAEQTMAAHAEYLRQSTPVSEVHKEPMALPPDFEAQVTRCIEKVRPFLQMDGGDIEIIAIEDNNVLVRLHGACSHCSISDAHMKLGVEESIRREVEGFGDLIVIE
jgi:Fe-S cluster biogenesis protein NfuA